MTNSINFGKSLAKAFAKESRASRFSEIAQFRALMRALGSLKTKFAVEEFHGAKHQVYFNGAGAWARFPARCELCDLAIISYSTEGGFRGKVTFLQAKLDKSVSSDEILLGFLGGKIIFNANMEQWDLLARRPDILPVHPFVAPHDLLSGAALASVGSFGVFYRSYHGKEAGFFYSSADRLVPHGSPSTRYAKLCLNGSHPWQRTVGGEVEQTYCPDIANFGAALFNLEIGTPIQDAAKDNLGNAYRYKLRRWVARTILTHIAGKRRDSVIVNEILDILPDSGDGIEFADSAPSIVIIRSSH